MAGKKRRDDNGFHADVSRLAIMRATSSKGIRKPRSSKYGDLVSYIPSTDQNPGLKRAFLGVTVPTGCQTCCCTHHNSLQQHEIASPTRLPGTPPGHRRIPVLRAHISPSPFRSDPGQPCILCHSQPPVAPIDTMPSTYVCKIVRCRKLESRPRYLLGSSPKVGGFLSVEVTTSDLMGDPALRSHRVHSRDGTMMTRYHELT
jgi:hypothetical protein